MTLRENFNALKEAFIGVNPESKLMVSVPAENTGELMDLASECNSKIVHPFSDSAEQNYYYFEYSLRKNLIFKVKSVPKKLKDGL